MARSRPAAASGEHRNTAHHLAGTPAVWVPIPCERAGLRPAGLALLAGDPDATIRHVTRVLELTGADAYRASRIENAIHVQHETIDEFLAIAEKGKPLIIYCYHGNSSQGAANYFDGLGFGEVYSVDGGFEAWRSKY